MYPHSVKNTGMALAYITDCCLATVANMATKKTRPKYEFKRQIDIAQRACDWMEEFGVDPVGTRAEDIIGLQSVDDWSRQFIEWHTLEVK